MKTIGFTNTFYTLWEVSEPYQRFINAHEFYEQIDHSYIQNLSKTLAGAKKKVAEMGIEKYRVDLEIRGEHSWTWKSELLNNFELWEFPFGKLAGQDIRLSDDVWQLDRTYREDRNPRRRVIARRRLIELGEIIRFPHEDWVNFDELEECDKDGYGASKHDDGKWYHYVPKAKRAVIPYITKQGYGHWVEQQETKRVAEKSQYIGKVGDKISIEVVLKKDITIDTAYGNMYIYSFQDDEGNVIVYKGNQFLIIPGVYTDLISGKTLTSKDKVWDKMYNIGLSDGRWHTDNSGGRLPDRVRDWLREETLKGSFAKDFHANSVDDNFTLYDIEYPKDKFIREGDRTLLTGTIKEHGEYNGVKQTILQRIKVAEIEPEAPSKAEIQSAIDNIEAVLYLFDGEDKATMLAEIQKLKKQLP
jgi:hypothetical protein